MSLFRGDQQGFSLPEMVMATGAMVFLALAAMSILQMQNSNSITLNKYAGVQYAKNAILKAFADDRAFANTYAAAVNAGAFGCLINQTTCTPNVTVGITYFDSSPAPGVALQMVADPGNPTMGFNPTKSIESNHSMACYTFNAQTGDDDCPFRYDVTWTALCDIPQTTGIPDCSNPSLLLTGTLQYKPKTLTQATNINIQNVFTFKYRRANVNAKASLAKAACGMLGGTMVNSICTTVQNVNSANTCAGLPNYLQGFSTVGQQNCTTTPLVPPLPPPACPHGVTIIASSGAMTCAP